MIEDDMDLEALVRLAGVWDRIMLQIRIASGISRNIKKNGKESIQNIGFRFHRVQSEIGRWINEHPDYADSSEDDMLLEMNNMRRSLARNDAPAENDLALIVLPSVQVLSEFALRVENLVRDFRSDGQGNEFPVDTIKLVLKAEERGEDVFEMQRKQGAAFDDTLTPTSGSCLLRQQRGDDHPASCCAQRRE
jgi:hypothetical protein